MSFKASWATPAYLTTNAYIATIPSGASGGDDALVGIFLERNTVVTPPDASWTQVGETTFVTSRGWVQVWHKHLAIAESGTWEFDLDDTSGGWIASALWGGRSGTLGVKVFQVLDPDTAPSITGTALGGDDAALFLGSYNEIDPTVPGTTTQIGVPAFGMYLFTADGLTAGDVTYTPSTLGTTSNTVWGALVTLEEGSGAGAPSANAGPDQAVTGGDTVTLSGSASGGTPPYSYSWAQTAGTTVTLSDSTSPTPTFTAPSSDETLTFQLTVTDSALLTATDTVDITITAQASGSSTIIFRLGGAWVVGLVKVRVGGAWK